MSTRSRIIEVTAALLAQSPTGDVSTRAVCEAAGVQQPALYRLFGDKDGLLAATVDHVWEQYLAMKRAAERSADPLDDLRAGWDSHTAFALAHPNAYRLLFATTLTTRPESADEAMRLLREVLDRLAADGRLRVVSTTAAQMVMAANTGVALALVLQPSLYPDAGLSALVRDATHRAILRDVDAVDHASDARTAAANTLTSGLGELVPATFSPAEAGLLGEWLARVPAAEAHSTQK
ncbi:TetR/AcrR family transcriptional regulator [Herbiconiux sp. CPCC 205763]|uniref:TetR/AcrR family transcriptional regulator n=1 Tax=Herbiconiux aconitum TaxID=2970913 RepID=A0ABT2GNL6_9MICO|nr:TetR/AcrR family transcriptional regulator [Herbiconiux aconitum]MCS5717197.1 TetR/AcrR family transcriptional regulator [Herbiconiux aconitum]